MSAPYNIRVVGDPVLRASAAEITDIDGKLVKLAHDMLDTMYQAPGLGLAAPQIGVGKRLFVYDLDPEARADPHVLVNPRIVESDGEWTYEEGCLSIPGLSFEIVRPKVVHLVGVDLDGNEVSIEADELTARLFQHELDHLDGVLMTERMDPDTKKQALKEIRRIRDRFEVAPRETSGFFS
ncbi:MAG TPA: peptide deformylase [Acidimicrobiaceae bacterium]|nr:peptide deformylase [Acidimicrobiaceae bacterium]